MNDVDENIYENFIGRTVDIGITHLYEKHRLFYITGKVLSVENGYLTLKIRNGYRKISFCDIIEISRSKQEGA